MALIGCSDSNVEKGAACLQLGDYPAAQEFFEKALQYDPRNYEARVGMGKALLQQAVDQENDSMAWHDACRHLAAARTLRPSESINSLLSQVWSERSRMLAHNRDTLAALEALTRAIEYDPKRSEPLNAAGIIYFRMGEVEKAKALLARAVSLDSNSVAILFNFGMVQWHAGDYVAAHRLWLKALKRSPKDKAILTWFALAEKQMREQDGNENLTAPGTDR